MGYSLAIRTRNQDLRKKMCGFMGEHFRSWPQIADLKYSSSASKPGLDLNYDSSKSALGVDYQSTLHGWDREYIYALTRWMAIRIGQVKTKFAKDVVTPNVFKKPVPFIVYDGYESWPLIVITEKQAAKLSKELQWCACDSLGLRSGEHEMRYVEHTNGAFDPKISKKAVAVVGPYPETGDRHAWRERYLKALFPYVKDEIETNVGLMRTEFKRLDKLWKAL
jgi:hypothetical protein